MGMTPTPKTDAETLDGYMPIHVSPEGKCYVPVDFARKLERERDEWKNNYQTAYDEWQQAAVDRDAWKAKAERTCVWSNREWSEFCKTECGERFQIPRQVKYKCCPFCGGRIVKEEE